MISFSFSCLSKANIIVIVCLFFFSVLKINLASYIFIKKNCRLSSTFICTSCSVYGMSSTPNPHKLP